MALTAGAGIYKRYFCSGFPISPVVKEKIVYRDKEVIKKVYIDREVVRTITKKDGTVIRSETKDRSRTESEGKILSVNKTTIVESKPVYTIPHYGFGVSWQANRNLSYSLDKFMINSSFRIGNSPVWVGFDVGGNLKQYRIGARYEFK